ncbi:mandelate racemase/muconate lactonizing enzyme family protein [Pseudaminobacter arsenicus]|uniref:Mandelate racemase/muconate lactonizing enzyme family protein n=1 Tax=Borborobacter arsenicus TaxID=1851146 RepID=A0A432VBP0_9HYPH|nr:mandelate racemase/muconate lactonizing enzyme family protein [Pseudaminobacter arsenicus]RUM99513.1 mandelate racemase/muconate lactonizing enzyme family protein [Pseudaminobacter arsenicus]
MIADFEVLSCDAGWRNYYFLKLIDDSGHVGWAEFDGAFSPPGVADAIPYYAQRLRGKSPLDHERIFAELYGMSRPAPIGLTAEAMGAIENALLDLKGKILGMPCYQLLGGKQREAVPVYWSHCASWRINHPTFYKPPITDLEGVRQAGRDARAAGYKAVKTNMFKYTDGRPKAWMSGFGVPWNPGLTISPALIRDVCEHLQALIEGAGPDVQVMIDLNFNARTEGYLQLVRALGDFPLYWIELDNHNPEALALIRQQSASPIASCETLFGTRQFLPYFQHQSMDVAIVDVIWNGAWQSMKIANAADAFDVNIAGHNFYGHLATMINVHFLAAMQNVKVLELDVDRLKWDNEFYPNSFEMKDGAIVVPDTPGWGIEPDEEAIRARPARVISKYLGFD